MKLAHLLARYGSLVVLLTLVGLGSSGCETTQTANVNPSEPWTPPGLDATTQAPASSSNTTTSAPPPPIVPVPNLQAGEKVQVVFTDLPPTRALQPHEQRIRGDGTITLPYNVTVMAAGKTPGQLEDAIRNAYVPALYKRLTVTVKADERTFFVGGEVKFSNRQQYTDRITVLRAIQAAGDFTDFANRKKIELRRSTGEKFIINWYDAKENPRLDLEVFPGDQIFVPGGIL